MNVNRCIVVPTANRAYAQQLIAAIGGAAYSGMFVSGLASPTGVAPDTHWVNAGVIDSQYTDLLPFSTVTYVNSLPVVSVVSAGSPATVLAAATAKGFSTTLAAVQALFAAVSVTDESPDTARSRLGIKQL